MRRIVLTLGLVLATPSADARPAVHVSAATEVARTEALRVVRAELEHALDDETATTLDISLTRLDITRAGAEVTVAVELRALASDATGAARAQITARASARGPAHDHALVERDALAAAAAHLVATVRRSSSGSPRIGGTMDRFDLRDR